MKLHALHVNSPRLGPMTSLLTHPLTHSSLISLTQPPPPHTTNQQPQPIDQYTYPNIMDSSITHIYQYNFDYLPDVECKQNYWSCFNSKLMVASVKILLCNKHYYCLLVLHTGKCATVEGTLYTEYT